MTTIRSSRSLLYRRPRLWSNNRNRRFGGEGIRMKSKTLRALYVGLMSVIVCASAVGQVAASGTFSGQVKDSAGKPQMGVLVELFNSTVTKPIAVFTDTKGFYTATGLLPGTYFIKATAASYLPSLRENLELKSGANVLVN